MSGYALRTTILGCVALCAYSCFSVQEWAEKVKGKDVVVYDAAIDVICATDCCGGECGDDICVPDCTGKECGSDDCSGSCGDCDDGEFCNGLETCGPDGKCLAGVLEGLNDGIDCTEDKCNEASKEITHIPNDNLCGATSPCVVSMCEPDSFVAPHVGCIYTDVDDGPNEVCDDQNPCTSDECKKGECVSDLLSKKDLEELGLDHDECVCQEDVECEDLEDGDACNGTLFCDKGDEEEGLCAVDPETVVTCTPDNWCETGDLTCNADSGECEGAGKPLVDDSIECTVDACDEDSDEVTNTPDNTVCDDENPCTDDLCDPASEDKDEKGCVFTAVEDGPCTDCDDDNPCTLNHRCESGLPVFDSFDCSDGNDCTQDFCNDVGGEAKCAYSNADDNAECGDGIDCTTADHCESGVCIATPDNSLCVAENACSAGTCDAEQGCLYEGIVCNDLIPCTNDSCDDELGCQYVPDNANCDDLIDCTDNQCLPESEAKDADGCVFVPDNTLCTDPYECTEDVCEAGVGCVFNPVHETCADVFACTTEDLCNPEADNKDAQGCAYTIDNIACNDTIGCTVDVCVVGIGCTNTPDNLACDDTFDCTENDICVEGQGCVYAPNDSLCPTDNIDCTDELCIVGQGCVSTPDHTKCDDTFDCTSNDTCDAVLGCVYTPDNSLCPDADGLACTLEECQEDNGCVAVPTDEECDDANTCTDDSCDPDDGCLFIPNEAACDDSDVCTLNDQCVAGICVPGAVDVGNPACVPAGDIDHDGLADDADSCPFAFDPQELDLDGDGQADACEPLPGSLVHERTLALTQDGAGSTWRRTNEPVEVPLVNGIIDDSVVGYYPLDGNGMDVSFGARHGVVQENVEPTDGAFGGDSTAMSFLPNCPQDNCAGGRIVADWAQENDFGEADFTVSIWLRREGVESMPSDGEHFFGLQSAEGDGGINIWMEDEKDADAGEPEFFAENSKGWIGNTKAGVRVDDGQWHHVAYVRSGITTMQSFVDGVLTGTFTLNEPHDMSGFGTKLIIGDSNESVLSSFHGDLDELIIFNRALSPDEIETYYRSSAPYGTSFVPGAQADFDDVRITEKTGDGDGDGNGDGDVTRSRVIGPRVHSDSACPIAEDDGSWADREDLCGVVAYWRMDGDATDVLGEHDGVVDGAVLGRGRFGEEQSGYLFDGEDDHVITDYVPVLGAGDSITIEGWIRPEAGQGALPNYLVGFEQGPSGGIGLTISETEICFSVRDDSFAAGGGWTTNCLQGTHFDGQWHHLAGVRDVAADRVYLYIDGLLANDVEDVTVFAINDANKRPLFLGALNHSNGVQYPLHGELDEVLIHSVAKSPDYIFHRANPGVPKVRFLANTVTENQGTEEAPSYPLREYKLHWGDADAQAQLPFVGDPDGGEPCYGLLNGCMGYAGWWRFNEGSGSVAVDSSTNKRNAAMSGSFEWVYGAENGMALSFGANRYLSIPGQSLLTGEGWTFETRFSPSQELVTCENPHGEFLLSKNVGGAANGDTEVVFSSTHACSLYAYVTCNGEVGEVVSDADKDYWLPGAWHSSALIWSSGVLSMAVDNEPQDDTYDYGPAVQMEDNNQNIVVGSDPPDFKSWNWLLASVDNYVIRNRGVTPDELLHYPLVSWELGCYPDCTGKQCGDDGCGGSCGTCGAGDKCTSFGACVDEDAVVVPDDQGTIQAAVDAAGNGDTVVVGPGTYDGVVLESGKEVHIESAAGPGETTISSDGNPNNKKVVVIKANGSSLSGFTIEGRICTDDAWGGTCVIVWSGTTGVTVSGNRIKNCSTGIAMSESSKSSLVTNNIIEDCNLGIWVDSSVTADIHNNLVANSIVPSQTSPCHTEASQKAWSGIGMAVFTSGDSVKAYNNIFYGNDVNIGINDNANNPFDTKNNLAWLTLHQANYWGEDFPAGMDGNVEIDPKFVNADANDFHLGAGSPAIDAGVAVAEVTDDFEGTLRPQGTAYDIGPYEVVDDDHDGIPDNVDECPGAFDPQQLDLDGNGQADACEVLGAGFAESSDLGLSQDGAGSTWRRTNEPVEIPLVNGILDDSVVGYWKLDGGFDEVGGISDPEALGAPQTVEGAFGDADGAMQFNGSTDGANLWKDRSFRFGGQFSVQVWMKAAPGNWGPLVSTLSGDKCHDHGWVLAMDDKDQLIFAVGGESSGQAANTAPYPSCAPPDDGTWHHVAAVRRGDLYQVFVDGVLCASKIDTSLPDDFSECGNMVQVGYNYHYDLQKPMGFLPGSIDEVILFNRALTPDEIETYYRSSAPYGTSFVPGAQADFDDVRITEKTGDGDGDGNGDGDVTRSRVIGARVHSDTGCPVQYAATPVGDIPGIESREDLCGVVGYWRLDGDAKDVMGEHDGVNSGAVAGSGRFGAAAGGMVFDGDDKVTVPQSEDLSFSVTVEEYTAEFWFRIDEDYGSDQFLVSDSADPVADIGMRLLWKQAEQKLMFSTWTPAAPGSNDQFLSDSLVVPGSWHHVAVVNDTESFTLFLDGLPNGTTEVTLETPSQKAIIFGANFSGEPHFLHGKMDDIVLHNVAKSPDYIYNRAHPGVPKVRFLANTEVEAQQDGSYALREYGLHWGDADAQAQLPFVGDPDGGEACYGLLNGCIGYAGWWRFNEGSGDVAVDSSGWKRNGELIGGPGYVQGMAGAALTFDGLDDRVSLPAAALDGAGDFSVEVSVDLDGTQTEPTFLSSVNAAGVDALQMRHNQPTSKMAMTLNGSGAYHDIDVSAGDWHAVGATRLQGAVSLFHDGVTIDASIDDASVLEVAAGGLQIGTEQDSPGGEFEAQQWWQGEIDEVRVMNRALTSDEALHYPRLAWEHGCYSDCTSKQCGDDGCGGSCGVCVDGECLDAVCVSDAGICLGEDARCVPAEYATIQAAIDAAADGDQVLVWPGTYVETVLVPGKDIEVRSMAGPADTVIQGDGQANYVVKLGSGAAGAALLEGFFVTGNGTTVTCVAGGYQTTSSAFITIKGNIMTGCNNGIALGENQGGSGPKFAYFINNLIYDVSQFGVLIDNSAAKVYNNTVVNAPEGFRNWANLGESYYSNNIAVDCGLGYRGHVSGYVKEFCNNLSYNNVKTWEEGISWDSCDNVEGDPKFVDPGNHDYHLQAGSPAVNAGKTIPTVIDDLDGVTRPQGAAYDIGAYEAVE